MGPENTIDMEEYQAENPENKIKQIPKIQNKMAKRKHTTKKKCFKKHKEQFPELQCSTTEIPEEKRKEITTFKKLIISMCAVDPVLKSLTAGFI